MCPSRGADLTEWSNGQAKSIVLAVAGAMCAPALAERANPGAIDSPGMLDDAVRITAAEIIDPWHADRNRWVAEGVRVIPLWEQTRCAPPVARI